MPKALLGLTLLVSVLFIAVAPSTAGAAANCHVSMSPYDYGNHPAAQVTYDTCTDVDKIQFFFAVVGYGEDFAIAGIPSVKPADTYTGINACSTSGNWLHANAGSSFTCQGGSGTICGQVAAQCSIWSYASSYSLICFASESVDIYYRLHRWSTNSWGSYTPAQSPYVQICY